MAEYYGPKVTRTIGDGAGSYDIVVFQAGKPPLDSELNLVGYLDSDTRANALRALVPSGWLTDPFTSEQDFYTDRSYSNIVAFGRQNEISSSNVVRLDPNSFGGMQAIVNGWVIQVSGTDTN